MNNNLYTMSLYGHVTVANKTVDRDFIPMHNEKVDKTFVQMEYKTYGELFGAPSRNRT